MAKELTMSGCAAAAQAAKAAKVEVICSYPIRPYTAIMMELAKMVANGELDAEFVHGEGEHAQLSVVLGAAAAGARALTGSSGVGVTYAFETYSPIAGGRVPLQMAIADRALDPPGDFGSEHTEAILTRDLANARRFEREVIASAVMVNASTRFNDGGELGLGAEIGISTTKLHAFGPMGLEELTTQKFVVEGDGHVRS